MHVLIMLDQKKVSSLVGWRVYRFANLTATRIGFKPMRAMHTCFPNTPLRSLGHLVKIYMK